MGPGDRRVDVTVTYILDSHSHKSTERAYANERHRSVNQGKEENRRTGGRLLNLRTRNYTRNDLLKSSESPDSPSHYFKDIKTQMRCCAVGCRSALGSRLLWGGREET